MTSVDFVIGVAVGRPIGCVVLLTDALLRVTPTEDIAISVNGGRA